MMVPALLFATLLATSPQQSDPRSEPIVARATQAYQALTSFSAEFEQVIADSMIGTYTSRGRLWQAGRSRFSMRFTDPEGEAVVMDGSAIWVYTPSTTPGQVIKYPIPEDGTGPNVLAWLLERATERYRSRYLRAERVGDRQTDVIELTPADSALPFRRATLWIDRADHLPRKLELVEPGGNRRLLTLTRVRLNAKPPKDAFSFEAPSGVRVIEQ